MNKPDKKNDEIAKELEQLKNAEQKYRSFVEKRNELNNIANTIREERDLVNNKRRELLDKMKQEKQKRNRKQVHQRNSSL